MDEIRPQTEEAQWKIAEYTLAWRTGRRYSWHESGPGNPLGSLTWEAENGNPRKLLAGITKREARIALEAIYEATQQGLVASNKQVEEAVERSLPPHIKQTGGHG